MAADAIAIGNHQWHIEMKKKNETFARETKRREICELFSSSIGVGASVGVSVFIEVAYVCWKKWRRAARAVRLLRLSKRSLIDGATRMCGGLVSRDRGCHSSNL